MNETVLYYSPSRSPQSAKLKGVLVRMKIRIRNISPEGLNQEVGFLVGLPGFEPAAASSADAYSAAENASACPEEMLVLYRFSESRLDELLRNLRKAGVKIDLKAIVTDSNVEWTLAELYRELVNEHARMSAPVTEVSDPLK